MRTELNLCEPQRPYDDLSRSSDDREGKTEGVKSEATEIG